MGFLKADEISKNQTKKPNSHTTNFLLPLAILRESLLSKSFKPVSLIATIEQGFTNTQQFIRKMLFEKAKTCQN